MTKRGVVCVVCGVSKAEFVPGVCGSCREAMAHLVLNGRTAEIGKVWQIGPGFDEARERMRSYQRRKQGAPPRAEVIALVASGLVPQGLKDDALLNAAESIRLGEASDSNDVGARALLVLFDRQLQQPEFARRLQGALNATGGKC